MDKRTDIWSFGVVLFEMLSGQRLFGGETIAHTVADVLRAPIDVVKLPTDTPRVVRTLITRCLDRDAKTRLRDIGEARLTIGRYLADPASGEVPDGARSARQWGAWAAAAVLAVLAIVGWLRPRPETSRPTTDVAFTIAPAEGGLARVHYSLRDGAFRDFAVRGDAAVWQTLDKATPADFLRSKSGSIVANDLDNIRLALTKLGVTLRFDAFTQQVLVNGTPLDDATFDYLWVRVIDTFKFRPGKDTLRTLIGVDARNDAFHPVRDYLDALAWDGVPRLEDWLVIYGGAESSPYARAVGALPLIAAVRRVRRPGEKFDELLVLECAQGTDKSGALRALCPNEAWFSDDLPLGVDSKQVIERTAGKWIIEAAEMHGHRGREAEQLKSFLSRQVDGPVRLAYARLSTSIPRQFVMIGTTNLRVGYLKDSTGGRRFWPVTLQGFDIEALQRDRDQLWAEAAVREAAGESIRLARELWAAAGIKQEQRRAADPWEEILEPIFERADTVIIDGQEMDAVPVAVLWTALGIGANVRDNRHADRIAAIADRCNFTEKKKIRASAGAAPQLHWLRRPSCSERSAEHL